MFKRITFFLLIFCLPFQLGKHFWPSDTIVRGFHLDLLSPVIYLTDILIVLYLVLNIPRLRHSISKLKPVWLLPIILFIIINVSFSVSPIIAFFAWIRWVFYFFLFIVLATEINLLKKIRSPFLISLSLICFIALFQLIIQHSLGGLFYLLGERPLSPLLPQIAKFTLSTGHLFLRPYSTFSHPNSLAGYLLVVLLILNQIKSSRILKYLKFLVLFTILITFSKSALVALAVFLPLPFIPLLALSLVVSFLPLLSSFVSFPIWIGTSAISRLNFGRSALLIIKDHPLFGVGLNNYLVSLSRYLPTYQISYTTLQPIHSVTLLFLAEFGLIGIFFLVYLFKNILPFYHRLPGDCQNLLKKLLLILAITGSVDHYWWTLPQNKLILVLILAIIFNRIYDKHQIRHDHH